MIFPHKQSEIGLQQRATIFVKTVASEIPVSLNVRVVDLYGTEVALCPKKKKDHDCVIKTLNEEFFVGGAKTDITFYCKGANTGGCKTKKPSQYRLYITLFYNSGSHLQFLSSVFLVRGNRRVRKDTNAVIEEDALKFFKIDEKPRLEAFVLGKDQTIQHKLVSLNTERERMAVKSSSWDFGDNPKSYPSSPISGTPSALFNPIILPGAKLLGSAFSLKRPSQDEPNHLTPPKKMNINNLVN